MMLAIVLALVAPDPPPAPQDPRPLQPLGAWVSDEDYPPGAIRRDVSGRVGFTLDVDAGGSPTRCTVTSPVDPELDQRTCEIFMARARFEPARDAAGRAVPGSYAGGIRWVLPPADEEGIPFAALRVTTLVARDAAGTVTCSLGVNGARPAPTAEEECGFLVGTGAAAAMRRLGTPGELILVYTMIPDRTSIVPAAGEAASDLIHEESARMVVTPDGTVAACQGAGPRPLRTLPGLRSLPRPCPTQNARFARPASEGAPRGAEISIRVYLRAGAR